MVNTDRAEWRRLITDREIGKLFRTFRIGLDLNQREAAEILEVPRSAISLIESGQRKLAVTEAMAMIRAATEERQGE